ncbi:MAG: ATP-binding protein [Chloroflexota bacterium]
MVTMMPLNEISCPLCGKPTLAQNRHCEHCGVDMAMAAGLAEQSVVLPETRPIALEALVPRIGEYMIEQGIIQNQDLNNALDYQKQQAVQGHSILLGEALLELGLVSRERLDQVITTRILQLQNALNEANRDLQRRVEERTQELQHALERLSELNRLKSNFIANISHELRTPLTHIKGYLDLLSDGGLGPLTQAQTEALGVLKRAETRLERLIEDLIQFSLTSRGDLSLDVKEVQIDRLVEALAERARPSAQSRQIAFSTVLPRHLPPVKADEDKIGWVIDQLIDNALKFTQAGGKVAVKVNIENKLVTIAVMDSGIGIPEERVNEIFEPFHQLDGDATRRYSGTGLGLAMVRRIIEAHGAQIRVRSAVNKGSRFEFSLPVADQAPKVQE